MRGSSSTSTAAVPRGPSRPHAWWIPLLAACLLLPELGGHVARREQEMRVLLTARDMHWTGRWIQPHYKDEPRLRKPPLMYWLVGGLYRLGAPVTSAAWSRLPSALAGIGFASVLYLLGRRLVGRRRAHTAALVAMASVIFLRQGKLAETDMTLSLFTATAALAGALALRRSARWWLPALLCAGIGFLVKGPAAVALPPAAWLAYAGWRRGRVIPPFRTAPFWIGLALAILIAAPWYVAISQLEHAATDRQVEAEMAALLTSSKHTGPIVYYFYTALHALAPWSLLLPVAVVHAFRLGRGRAGWAFPLMWFCSTFVILSCLSSKQIHYALLLVAPGALLIGCTLHARRRWVRQWSRGVSLAIVWLLLAAGLALPALLALHAPPPPFAASALCLLAAGLMVRALRTAAPAGRAPLAALALASLLPAALCLTTREGAHGTATREVAQAALGAAPAGAPIVCLGPLNTTCAFYVDRPVSYADTLEAAWAEAAPGTLILATWKKGDRPAPDRLPGAPLLSIQDRATCAAAFLKP